MKVVASTSSSSHEDKKDEHSKQQKRYKYSHDQFDCVSAKLDNFACLNGIKIFCTYCVLRFNKMMSLVKRVTFTKWDCRLFLAQVYL